MQLSPRKAVHACYVWLQASRCLSIGGFGELANIVREERDVYKML